MNIDIQETIFIVVGSEIVPEEKDRPLAYALKEHIDQHSHTIYQRAIVVSDRWYLENDMFQICPSILIGGPGVNAATGTFYNEMAVLWTDENNVFVQLMEDERYALWGMNQQGTIEAIEHFKADGYLLALLEDHWKP